MTAFGALRREQREQGEVQGQLRVFRQRCGSSIARPSIFKREQLQVFELTPETVGHCILRKQYLEYSLTHHPNKNSGVMNYVFDQW